MMKLQPMGTVLGFSVIIAHYEQSVFCMHTPERNSDSEHAWLLSHEALSVPHRWPYDEY